MNGIFYSTYYMSPIGKIYLYGKSDVLVGCYFSDTNIPLYFLMAQENHELRIFAQAKEWLSTYFSGKQPDFMPKLDVDGCSPFCVEVWDMLLSIPYGATKSYGELAARYEGEHGTPMASQAIGGAVKKNVFPIIVPCHRVIGKNGRLTGYAGGLWRKKFLLEHEGASFVA